MMLIECIQIGEYQQFFGGFWYGGGEIVVLVGFVVRGEGVIGYGLFLVVGDVVDVFLVQVV